MKKFIPLVLLVLNIEPLSLAIICFYVFLGIGKLFCEIAEHGNW